MEIPYKWKFRKIIELDGGFSMMTPEGKPVDGLADAFPSTRALKIRIPAALQLTFEAAHAAIGLSILGARLWGSVKEGGIFSDMFGNKNCSLQPGRCSTPQENHHHHHHHHHHLSGA